MPTKSCNQHEPLHQLYGHSDCCLCRVERERDALRKQLDIAVKLLKNLKPILDKLGYGIGDTLTKIEKVGKNE